MFCRTRPYVAALALAGAMATPAIAQERPAEFDTWSLPGWTFTPSIGIGGMWDSNVGLAGNQPAGRPTDRDTFFVFEPHGQLEFRNNRTEFLGAYKGYLRRYVDVDELNGFDQRMYLSFQRQATKRLSFFVRNDYADIPSTDDLDLNGVLYGRTGSLSNRLSGGIEARLTKYDDLSVTYENTWVKFDSETVFTQGGFLNGVFVDYGRRLSARTTVGGEYRGRQADMNDANRVMWFHDMGGVVHQAFGPHLMLTGAGGYSVVLDPRLDEKHGGAYVRAELSSEMERSSAGVSYERSFAPTFGFGGSSESQELRGFFHMPITRNRFYVQGSGSWRRTNPLLIEQEIDLDSFNADGVVGYGPSRWLRVEGFYHYTRQDSRITGGEVNRHRIGGRVVLAQPMRIH